MARVSEGVNAEKLIRDRSRQRSFRFRGERIILADDEGGSKERVFPRRTAATVAAETGRCVVESEPDQAVVDMSKS